VALGGALVAFVGVGVGFYTQTVFLDALVVEQGWDRARVSAASGLYFVVSGLAGPLVGMGVDRFGPRPLIIAGSLVMAVALLWIGRVESAAGLLLAYPLLAVGFAMTGGIPANALIARWFVALRARAMSISQTGVSVGGVVLVPLTAHLIQSRGIAETTAWLAALVVAVAIPVTLLVLRADPADHGLLPDDGRQPAAKFRLLASQHQQRVWTAREVLRTRTYWMLAAAIGAILFSQTGALVHELSLVREHLDAPRAALAVSATAGASIVGRLIVGSFADRLNKQRLGMALFTVQALSLVAFSYADTSVGMYGAAVLFGLMIGNIFMMSSLLAGEFYGARSFGTASGLLAATTQVLSGLGPIAVGLLYGPLGGYAPVLRLLSLVSLLAVLLLWLVPPPRETREP